MSGTKEGGAAAAATNKEKYGEDFYAKIGSKGGTKTHESGKLYQIGFGGDRQRAREAGRKGGTISRRGKANATY